MKSTLLFTFALLVVATTTRSQNLILNGSFENNTAIGNSINLTSAWSSTVSNSFEVDGGSMDLITVNNCGNASNGNWYVTCSPQGGVWPYMAFSLKLSTTLNFGAQYTLTFDKRFCGPNSSPIDIGISTDSTQMGSAVHTFIAPTSTTWATETYVFQAMLAATYLTVNVGTTGSTGIVGLDNFSLQSGVVGIAEHSNAPFQVAPNPSNGKFNIVLQGTENENTIEIYNLLGEPVYKGKIGNHKNEIDLTLLQKGIYFIKINEGDKTYAEKISIQ